ncbi:hypothetical protein [Aeromonas sp. 3P]|uniref:hypothetical protein n=1 Tax=Aeromonas sp. 3P TaxID=3452719 RepID=UPI003F79A013
MNNQLPQTILRFRSDISDSEKAKRLSEFIDTMRTVHTSLSMSDSVPIVLCAARTTLAATYLLFNGRAFSHGHVTKILTLEDIEWTMSGTLEAEFYGEIDSKDVASRLTELYERMLVIRDYTCWITEAGIDVMDSLMRRELGEAFKMPDFVTEFMEEAA